MPPEVVQNLKASGEVVTQHAVNVPTEGSNPSLPAFVVVVVCGSSFRVSNIWPIKP